MKKETTAAPKPFAVTLLLALSVAEALLAVYQWLLLLVVRSGGQAICEINEFLSCGTVWNSELAKGVHRWTGVPVAGLGLLWGLLALSLSIAFVQRLLAERNTAPLAIALKLVGAVGAGICLLLALWSALNAHFCVSCLATYLLVLAFAFVSLRLLPAPSSTSLLPAIAWIASLGAVFYLLLLYPGLRTPQVEARSLAKASKAISAPNPGRALEAFIGSLDVSEKQMLADSLALYKKSPPLEPSNSPPRARFGPLNAPVQIVDFTDIRCPHCRQLEETLTHLKRNAPAGALSVESRQFPLDADCNIAVGGTDGTGVRCLAAKVQICLERSTDYWDLRSKLFAAQDGLTQPKVWEIGSSGKISRPELEKCVNSPETAAKLNDDIRYAMQYRPTGTPIVIVNGRQAPPFDGFLLAMVMTGGNPDDASFASLPSPNLATQ